MKLGRGNMGRLIQKWAKLNFAARHYDPCAQGNKGHNGVRQNSTWPISICGGPYASSKLCWRYFFH